MVQQIIIPMKFKMEKFLLSKEIMYEKQYLKIKINPLIIQRDSPQNLQVYQGTNPETFIFNNSFDQNQD